MEMHRQGDILFTKVEKLPEEGLTPRQSKVIAEGEVTGHSHRLLQGRVFETAMGILYLEVLVATQVVHQEHGAIDLEPGLYKVTRQREYVAPEIDRMVLD